LVAADTGRDGSRRDGLDTYTQCNLCATRVALMRLPTVAIRALVTAGFWEIGHAGWQEVPVPKHSADGQMIPRPTYPLQIVGV
jgi:hypothetical protein